MSGPAGCGENLTRVLSLDTTVPVWLAGSGARCGSHGDHNSRHRVPVSGDAGLPCTCVLNHACGNSTRPCRSAVACLQALFHDSVGRLEVFELVPGLVWPLVKGDQLCRPAAAYLLRLEQQWPACQLDATCHRSSQSDIAPAPGAAVTASMCNACGDRRFPEGVGALCDVDDIPVLLLLTRCGHATHTEVVPTSLLT